LMLMSNPQLGYALLQAQVVMRIVDPQTAIAMLHREPPNIRNTPFHLQTQTTVPTPTPVHSMPPLGPNVYPPTAIPPVPNFVPPQIQSHYPSHISAPPPTSSSIPPQVSQPTPAAAPAAARSAPPSNEDEQNAQLLMQVLQLSEEQIAALPPEDRQKVLELRSRLRTTVQ